MTYKAQKTVVEGKQLVRRRFYLDTAVWESLEAIARKTGKTPSELVEELIKEQL